MALYDELGGAPAVSLALETFYAKVPGHPVVGPYFVGVDFARLKERATPFVVMALGGPAEYKGAGLRNVHRHLLARGLNDEAFDAFVGLFDDVLTELAVSPEKRSEVKSLLNGARGEVLNL